MNSLKNIEQILIVSDESLVSFAKARKAEKTKTCEGVLWCIKDWVL
jgi:hypothetical protein